MELSDLELKIIQFIKILRISNSLKQLYVARALGMSESEYCKLEKEKRKLTFQILENVSCLYKISIMEIAFHAESDNPNNYKLGELDKIIKRVVCLAENEEILPKISSELPRVTRVSVTENFRLE